MKEMFSERKLNLTDSVEMIGIIRVLLSHLKRAL